MDPTLFNWPLVIAGGALGLFGWILYRAGLPVIGGLLGAAGGASLAFIVTDLIRISQVEAPAWVQPLGLGLGIALGAFGGVMLTKAIQLYAFFVVGAVGGGALGWHVGLRPPVAGWVGPPGSVAMVVMVALAALVGGLLLVKLRRFIVAMITAVGGAVMLAAGLPPAWQVPGLIVCVVVFLGAQIGLVRRYVDDERFDHRAHLGRQAAARAEQD